MKKLLYLALLLIPAFSFATDGVLTGTYPADTYGGILHLNGNTGLPAATPGIVYDGLGNIAPFLVSQTTFQLNIVNAAGGSANPFDYTGTLGIMNGSDDFTLFDINMTNANHTGTNTIQIMDIANITGDAEATETAINIGTGWDSGITSASPITGSTLTSSGVIGSAGLNTITIDGNNGATEFLQITNSNNGATGQTGDTASISFDMYGSTDSGSTWVADEAARIEAFKISDWWGANANDFDSGLKIYGNGDGNPILIATFSPNIATGATALTLTGTLDSGEWGRFEGANLITQKTAGNQVYQAGRVGFGTDGVFLEGAGANDTELQLNWPTWTEASGDLTGEFCALDAAVNDGQLILGAASANSTLTFDGADAAGNWKLIDMSGAGGINDANDYYIYFNGNNYITGSGNAYYGGLVRGYYLLSFQACNGANMGGNEACYGSSVIQLEGATDSDTDELTITFPTFSDGGAGNQGGASDPTVYMPVTWSTPGGYPNDAGDLQINGGLTLTLTADAVLQVGMVAMNDAGTDARFDAATNGSEMPIGVYQGTGPSAQGTAYALTIQGMGYLYPQEDLVSITRGWICAITNDVSAANGSVECAAALASIDHDAEVGHPMYSEAAIELATATAGTDVIVMESDPAWAVNDPVVYWDSGGTAVTGLTDGTVYWIKTESTTSITLCATRGCATAVDIGGDWSASDGPYLMRLPKSVIHWN